MNSHDAVWRQVLPTHTDPTHFPLAELSWHTYNPDFGTPEDIISWQAVVFEANAPHIHLAMVDPSDISRRDAITHHIMEKQGFQPRVTLYQADMDDIMTFIHGQKETKQPERTSSLLEEIIRSGVMQEASDIHLHPQESQDLIRFRIHGQLITHKSITKQESDTLVNRLKVLSNLHLTETKRPQSGRFSYGSVDIRTAFQSTILGESVALRLLPRKRALMPLQELGLTPEQQHTMQHMLQTKHGLIVCCGATGAGKTTTLYALLNELDPLEHNIMTLEDPVEYPMPSIRQTEIKPGVLDFADGIRALLRHDPDVMLIGEIRDADTAQMAIRAAMTGHLVLTTLHTHDVWSIPGRLADLGISPIMIAGHLIGAIHQKLIPHPTGRTLQAEVLTITPALQEAIGQGMWGSSLKNLYKHPTLE